MTTLTDKEQSLLKRFAPMGDAQLKNVVLDYLGAFPGWQPGGDGAGIVRVSGPIKQMIWFQKLSGAEYRPTHVIRSTVVPQSTMLHQVLGARNRQVKLSQHEKFREATVAAMAQQFKPSVSKPLEIGEVLELCRLEARMDATNDLAMLASLLAWQGETAEATAICEQMQTCPLPGIAAIPEWEAAMREFGRELATAIRAGKGQHFLEDMIASARSA